MQNEIIAPATVETPATVATPVKATPVKAKPAKRKPVAAKPAKPVAKPDAAPVAVNVHRGTVSTAKYTGPSQYLNANRVTAIGLGTYAGRNVATLTTRTLGTLAAMRDAYGTKSFPARGFDNAILAMLAGCTTGGKATPFIKLAGGHTVADKTGRNVLCDAPGKPVTVAITAAGAAYGKASK